MRPQVAGSCSWGWFSDSAWSPGYDNLLRCLFGYYDDIAVEFAACNRQPIVGPVERISVNPQIPEVRHSCWRSADQRLPEQVRNALFGDRVVNRFTIGGVGQLARQCFEKRNRLNWRPPGGRNDLNHAGGLCARSLDGGECNLLPIGRDRQ